MKPILEVLNGRQGRGQPAEDEYVNSEDGLLYCSKCHTPRQLRSAIKGSPDFICVPVLCRCQREKSDAEEAACNRRQFAEKVIRLRQTGFTAAVQRGYTFECDAGFVPQMAKAHKYVDNFESFEKRGQGLLLWGKCGSGKTFMAGCIANALIDRGIPVLMTNFSRVLTTLTCGTNKERSSFIDDLDQYRLLIIDDLGIERDTSFAFEQVFAVIDHRASSMKPMIITTNLTLPQLNEAEDTDHARIYSRILEHCIPVAFTENNVRRQKTFENYNKLGELLLE